MSQMAKNAKAVVVVGLSTPTKKTVVQAAITIARKLKARIQFMVCHCTVLLAIAVYPSEPGTQLTADMDLLVQQKN